MSVGRVGLHGTNLSGMSGQDLGRKTVCRRRTVGYFHYRAGRLLDQFRHDWHRFYHASPASGLVDSEGLAFQGSPVPQGQVTWLTPGRLAATGGSPRDTNPGVSAPSLRSAVS